ncbi:hypothetical protein [Actinomadura sp. GTD37]|uniref:hypothetical protein n=1 Tax=Actinomadura sp. GTD37 TaxID=1778030 RepID=UPI0035C222C5
MADGKLPTVFVVEKQYMVGGDWDEVGTFDTSDEAIGEARKHYYRGGPDVRIVRHRKKVIW